MKNISEVCGLLKASVTVATRWRHFSLRWVLLVAARCFSVGPLPVWGAQSIKVIVKDQNGKSADYRYDPDGLLEKWKPSLLEIDSTGPIPPFDPIEGGPRQMVQKPQRKAATRVRCLEASEDLENWQSVGSVVATNAAMPVTDTA